MRRRNPGGAREAGEQGAQQHVTMRVPRVQPIVAVEVNFLTSVLKLCDSKTTDIGKAPEKKLNGARSEFEWRSKMVVPQCVVI